MKYAFRLECPKCHWGKEIKGRYINQGFLYGKCQHCGHKFYFKITVTGVNVQVENDLPEGNPCGTLDEAKTDEISEM